MAVGGEFRGDFLEEPTCCRRKRSVDNNTVLEMDINGESGADEVGISRAFVADVTGQSSRPAGLGCSYSVGDTSKQPAMYFLDPSRTSGFRGQGPVLGARPAPF